jgi:hypothetical protein
MLCHLAINNTRYENPTMRFSCGARSASKLKVNDYLRSMLSRRQLQALVRCRREINANAAL